MLRLDASDADVDLASLRVDPHGEGIAIVPWGSRVPRMGEVFAYEGVLLEAVRFNPRAPTPQMRREYRRPDYWLTVRIAAEDR